MPQHTNSFLLIAPIILLGLLLYIFERTDPVSIGPGGVLGVFILMYLLALSVLFIILHTGVPLVSRIVMKKRGNLQAREVKIGVKKAYYVASLVAFIPVLLLAMGSFAQLKLTDVVLIVVFVALVTFYIIKRR